MPPAGCSFFKTTNQASIARVVTSDRSPSNPRASEVDAEFVGDLSASTQLRARRHGRRRPPAAAAPAAEAALRPRGGDRSEPRARSRGACRSATTPQLRSHPALKGVALPEQLGAAGAAGVLATAGGLVFVGGNDIAFHALDIATGRELWRMPLPRRVTGTPMTYRSRAGRQFVVVATSAGADAALVAFALPRRARRRSRGCRGRRFRRAAHVVAIYNSRMCDFGQHHHHDPSDAMPPRPFGFLVDVPEIRELIAETRRLINEVPDVTTRVAALKPAFAKLLAATDWLPEEYASPDLASGMGGGIGQYALYRAEDGSLMPVLAGHSGRGGNARSRSSRLGPDRRLSRPAGRNRLPALDDGASDTARQLEVSKRQTMETGEFYSLDSAARRHPLRQDRVRRRRRSRFTCWPTTRRACGATASTRRRER